MSNYHMKAIEKETGKEVEVTCIDGYFGGHRYGYKVYEWVYTQEEFEEHYQVNEQ